MSGSIQSGRKKRREGRASSSRSASLTRRAISLPLLADDVIGIRLTLAVVKTVQGCEDSLVEPFSPQILSAVNGLSLDQVMEDRHDFRRSIFHRVHDTKWVQRTNALARPCPSALHGLWD